MKPVIPVACGVLRKPGGEVLIAQRPEGKIAAGKWEFPGGKIEAGESSLAALKRELAEELGIEVLEARPLIYLAHDYSDRRVILDTWLVTSWRGQPRGQERQGIAWAAPDDLHAYDLLAADGPILQALRLPTHYVFTPADADPDWIAAKLPSLPKGSLLRLRLPSLSQSSYEQAAKDLLPETRRRGLHLILDRSPRMAEALHADGWHATAEALRASVQRPTGLVLASVHGVEEIQRAGEMGCDALVLGPVRPTSSHPGAAGIGWGAFTRLAMQANRPVYAIGGLGPASLPEALQNYAQGVAGISAYW